jgi:beta-glucosidase
MINRTCLVVAALAVFASVPLAAQTSDTAALWGTQGADCKAAEGEEAPWRNRSYTPECRARFVLNEFRTLEEKFRFLSPPPPGQASEVRDVAAELGLPPISGSDGPAGLARGPAATALPSPLAVAASFDRDVARRYGSVMASEFRAAGLGNVLGPAFDIARSWKFGRLSESFGEDPFLTAAMAGAEVRALADGGVMSTMKHYAVYAQEAGRVGDQPSGSAPTGDNIVSEKALREIYLPGFEAAVREGGAGGVMCSFPKVNGVYACENPHLYDILKREWGFDGAVMPDFPSAQRSITRAVLAGLDGGSLAPGGINAGVAGEKPLIEAVRDGEVPEARIDDMILRRLIPQFRLGLVDNPPGPRQGDDVSTPENRAAAADILAAGTVLLKNERGILPFGPEVRSIAVIGLQATDQATVVEQGSPYVRPVHLEPALAAIEARAGAGEVRYAQGTLGLGALPPIDPTRVTAPGGEQGFLAEYVANRNLDFSGEPLARRVVADPSLAATPEIAGMPAGNAWSVRYTGHFTPAQTGIHRFTLHGSGTARLIVGDVERGFELADFGNAAYVNVPLRARRPVDIRIEYTPRSALRPQRLEQFGMEMGLTLRFGHAPPDNLIAEAAAAARRAEVAVVFVGERVGEGMDRHSLSLQGDQDALIEAVAAANPDTVVVLSTGGPVAMPWLGKVRAVLETWLPGDAYGPAVAGMLFGDREPGGRLPVTFPADKTQGPATQRHQFPGLYDPTTGKLDTAYFDEGVFVGYRYYQAHDQTPLFPFGHGLSYGNVRMEVEGLVPTPSRSTAVRVRLTNTGTRPGTAVPQLYMQFPEGTGEPPWQLKAFAKVTVAPGETQVVDIPMPYGELRYWDEQLPGWRFGDKPYRVAIGRSANDLIWYGWDPIALWR